MSGDDHDGGVAEREGRGHADREKVEILETWNLAKGRGEKSDVIEEREKRIRARTKVYVRVCMSVYVPVHVCACIFRVYNRMVTVVVSSSSICCEALRPAIKSARQTDLAPDVLSSFNLRATEKNFRFVRVDNSDELSKFLSKVQVRIDI